MNPNSLLNQLTSGLGTLSSLPWGAHAIPIVVLICGIMFWLAGGRFLKQLFVLLGIVGGAAIGAVAGPDLLPARIGSIPGSYAAMGAGGILGLIAALLAFRFAMAFCSALVLAAAASLGVGVYLSYQPSALPMNEAIESRERLAPGAAELTDQYRQAVNEYAKSGDSAGGESPSADSTSLMTTAAADATRQFAQAFRTEAQSLWDSTPERSRLLLLAAAAAGGIVGAAAGMAMPKKAASIITAVLGAAVTLFAARWLAPALDLPGNHLLAQRGPTGLLGIWAALALFGVVVQWQSGKKRAPAPKAEPAAA